MSKQSKIVMLLVLIIIVFFIFAWLSGTKYGYNKAIKNMIKWHDEYNEKFCICRETETWKDEKFFEKYKFVDLNITMNLTNNDT